MILHTVVISFQRLDLLQRTIKSYLNTVTVPYHLMVVDNGSDSDVISWLEDQREIFVSYMGENRYPGYACNRGFEYAGRETTHLHRSDSDMLYLPGWCDHAQAAFASNDRIALVGLRTSEEEGHTPLNTGGTAIIKRDIWNRGLRYAEHRWRNDFTEDWKICQDVVRKGYEWARVDNPSVVHLATGDINDPYYQHSFGVRGILEQMKEVTSD